MDDIELFGTAVAILAKANPAVAVAIGAITGIFGKIFFDKAKTSAKKKKENNVLLEKILKVKEKHAKELEQLTEDSSV